MGWLLLLFLTATYANCRDGPVPCLDDEDFVLIGCLNSKRPATTVGAEPTAQIFAPSTKSCSRNSPHECAAYCYRHNKENDTFYRWFGVNIGFCYCIDNNEWTLTTSTADLAQLSPRCGAICLGEPTLSCGGNPPPAGTTLPDGVVPDPELVFIVVYEIPSDDFEFEDELHCSTTFIPDEPPPPPPDVGEVPTVTEENPKKSKSGNTSVGVAAGASAGALVAVCVAVLALFFVFRTKKRSTSELRSEIDFKDIVLGERIGRGTFGEVLKGRYRGTNVAVKMIVDSDDTRKTRDPARKKARMEFLREVDTMCHLRHPNIVLFMGACTKAPNVAIVTELMHRGSVYDLLHQGDAQLSSLLRVKMIEDTVHGMLFLHESQPPIFHRDLKSLNLLVDDTWNTKVADFGLTMKEGQGKQAVGSLLWASPEVLSRQPYVKESDVFSFGITCWEIATRAELYEQTPVLAAAYGVREGELRPDVDNYPIAPKLKALMVECWHQKASRRPDFNEISSSMQEIKTEARREKAQQARAAFTGGSSRVMTHDEIRLAYSSVKEAPTLEETQEVEALPHDLAPMGSCAIVCTSIENGSALWKLNPAAMKQAVTVHNNVIRSSMAAADGYEAACNVSDFCIVFQSAIHALRFAIILQIKLMLALWPSEICDTEYTATILDEERTPVFCGPRIKTGISAGDVDCLPDNTTDRMMYTGLPMEEARKARTKSVGGQVLISARAAEIVNNQLTELGIEVTIDPPEDNVCVVRPAILKARTFEDTHEKVQHTPADPRIPTLVDDNAVAEDLSSSFVPIEMIEFGRQIGVGTYGLTFEGTLNGNPAALKSIFRRRVPEDVVLDLMEEMITLRQISHPNVVSLLGACVTPQIVLCYTYIDGSDLSALLHDSQFSLNTGLAGMLLCDMSRGMAHLHNLDPPVLHRDLKSSNILVRQDNVALVADFGLARIKSATRTMTQSSAVAWMAPEILKRETYTPGADIYSFGIVCWEVLTRDIPFRGVDAVLTTQQVLSGERPPVNTFQGTAFCALVTECWSSDIAQRPAFASIVERLQDITGSDANVTEIIAPLAKHSSKSGNKLPPISRRIQPI